VHGHVLASNGPNKRRSMRLEFCTLCDLFLENRIDKQFTSCCAPSCRIIIPEHAEVANAVGAAIPSIAGVVDTLLPAASGTERQAQIQAAVQQAVAAAVAAGVYCSRPTQCPFLISPVFFWRGEGGCLMRCLKVNILSSACVEQVLPAQTKSCLTQ
jgi:hypothetical protein